MLSTTVGLGVHNEIEMLRISLNDAPRVHGLEGRLRFTSTSQSQRQMQTKAHEADEDLTALSIASYFGACYIVSGSVMFTTLTIRLRLDREEKALHHLQNLHQTTIIRAIFFSIFFKIACARVCPCKGILSQLSSIDLPLASRYHIMFHSSRRASPRACSPICSALFFSAFSTGGTVVAFSLA